MLGCEWELELEGEILSGSLFMILSFFDIKRTY